MTDAELAELERLANDATPGPWIHGATPDSPEAAAAWIADCYHKGAPGHAHMAIAPCGDKPIEDEALVVAITGNGPTSRQNLKFIAASRTAVPALVAMVRELRAEVAKLATAWGDDAIQKLDLYDALHAKWRDAQALNARWMDAVAAQTPDEARADLDAHVAEVEQLRAQLAEAWDDGCEHGLGYLPDDSAFQLTTHKASEIYAENPHRIAAAKAGEAVSRVAIACHWACTGDCGVCIDARIGAWCLAQVGLVVTYGVLVMSATLDHPRSGLDEWDRMVAQVASAVLSPVKR